tara:strand:+ start:918 stop:1391 length:474 start_codon:yes stop_codon:yes gene_type:complete
MRGGEDKSSEAQMSKIQESLKQTLKTQNTNKNSMKAYSEVNKKLANGLEVSLNVIVDMSKILKNYHVFLDEIQDLLASMNTMYADDSDSIDELKNLTDRAISKLNSSFGEQLDDIAKTYRKNNMDASQLDDLKRFLSENVDTETSYQTSEENLSFKK